MTCSQAVKRAHRELLGGSFSLRLWNYAPLNIHGLGYSLKAIRQVRQILKDLEEEAYEWGVEQTKMTIGDWHKPC